MERNDATREDPRFGSSWSIDACLETAVMCGRVSCVMCIAEHFGTLRSACVIFVLHLTWQYYRMALEPLYSSVLIDHPSFLAFYHISG